MKRNFKKILISIFTAAVLLLPLKAQAASFSVGASKSTVSPGENVTFTFSSDTAFSASAINIKYDTSKWNLISHTPLKGAEVANPTAGLIMTSISVTTGTINGSFYQIVLQSKSDAISGSSSVSISTSDCWAEDGMTAISMNSGAVSVNHYLASSDNNLKSLSITNCPINFNSNVTEYSCSQTEADSIVITAVANDAKAKITGAGNIKLNYGNNALKVVVTAENGSAKTYIINITKKDSRNGDSKLASLIIEGHEISFDADKTEYTLTVDDDTEKITIRATAANSNSRVTGTGTLEVKTGSNRFPIAVTAENGNITTYFVNVNKADKNSEPSTTLIELSYNDMPLDVSKRVFAIGVSQDITELSLVFKTASKTSNYIVRGNENLKSGINIITIKVTDMDATPTTYTLVVDKKSYEEISNLSGVTSFNSNVYYNEKDAQTKLPLELYEQLKKTNNNLIINNTNKNNGLNYSLTINKDSSIDSDTYLYITKSKENPLTYDTNIPSNIAIKLFVDEQVNGDSFKLYGYDAENGAYKLIEESIKVNNHYLEFTSEGYDQYILSNDVLSNNKLTKEEAKNYSGVIYFIGGVLLASGAFAGVIIFLKKKKEKEAYNNNIVQ